MVIIDESGELTDIKGSAGELCGNAASIIVVVMEHICESCEDETAKGRLLEGLVEATLRTVMELGERREIDEAVTKACKTVGEAGHFPKGALARGYSAGIDGLTS